MQPITSILGKKPTLPLRTFKPVSLFQPVLLLLQVKRLLQLSHCILWIRYCMPNCPSILIELMIVPPLLSHVAKEMNLIINQATLLLFGLHMPQTIRLIPPDRKSIEGKLPSNRIRQPQVRKFPLQRLHHRLPDRMLLVIPLELVPLRVTCISSNRRNIHHPIPELDKCAPLDGNIQVGNVCQHPVDQRLVLCLADPLDEGGTREGDAQFEGREAVFGKAEVEEGGHRDGGSAELLLRLGKVGTTDVADRALVAETGEEGEHLWRGRLDGGVSWDFWDFLGGEGAVHTLLAGPRVLSTSKRQIVFFIGRASRGG